MSQATNETAYTGYARKAVARSGGGWTVSAATVTNAAAITFGECTASPGAAITHASIGYETAGATRTLAFKALSSPLTMAVGTIPRFAAGDLDFVLSGDFGADAMNDLLLLLFNNTDIANMGDASGVQNSASAGSFFVGLHTGAPT